MKFNDFDVGSKVQKYQSDVKTGIDRAREPAKKTADQTDSLADNIQLSEWSQEIVRIKEVVEAAPEIRQDKVDAVKARLAEGTYEADSEEVANRILTSSLQEIV